MLIKSVDDLQVGDIGFGVIPGRVGGLVSLGQALLRDECWLTHAFIVAQTWPAPAETYPATARIVEAMPGGASVDYLRGQDRIGPGWAYIRLPLTAEQRDSVTMYATDARGTPYSFLDYVALAGLHWGIRGPIRRRVTSSGHMICSQLVDQVLTLAGYHLFTDGRLPQDVTPGALFRQAGAQGEVCWW